MYGYGSIEDFPGFVKRESAPSEYVLVLVPRYDSGEHPSDRHATTEDLRELGWIPVEQANAAAASIIAERDLLQKSLDAETLLSVQREFIAGDVAALTSERDLLRVRLNAADELEDKLRAERIAAEELAADLHMRNRELSRGGGTSVGALAAERDQLREHLMAAEAGLDDVYRLVCCTGDVPIYCDTCAKKPLIGGKLCKRCVCVADRKHTRDWIQSLAALVGTDTHLGEVRDAVAELLDRVRTLRENLRRIVELADG